MDSIVKAEPNLSTAAQSAANNPETQVEPTFSTSAQLLASDSDLVVRPPVAKPNTIVQRNQALHFEAFSTKQSEYRPAERAFPLYEELNNIAEELEKCRSKIS